MILVDTSVWIDFLHGKNSIYRHALHNLIEKEEDVCISGIILTEILQGIRDDEIFSEIKCYLLEFPIYNPKDVDTYIFASNIFRQCKKKGKTVRKTVDCLIAAIAIENGLILLHNDRDFDSIKQCADLKVVV